MPYFETKDQTQLYFTDWGNGKPMVFIHAWAMHSAMWEQHMMYFNDLGMRCIAYDQRGHGRSDCPGHGYSYNQFADDLSSLLRQLDLNGVTLIGHSMGGAEIIRFLSRHGSNRIARVVLLSPALPYLKKSADNQDGFDPELLEKNREVMKKDFPGWLKMGAGGFYRPNEFDVSEGIINWTIDMILETSLKAAIEGNKIVTETDFRQELKAIKVPVLLIHGDADESIPIHFGRKASQLIPNCKYIEYPGAAHGIFYTHMDRLFEDIIAFVK